jgi:molybdopterin-binding protein
VAHLADILHLDGLLDSPATKLSIGQKQRVALARALATEPDVLLLDEPFSSLDPPLKTRLWREMGDIHSRTGVTTLHVTHERAEAQALAGRIAIISAGRIRQVGGNDEVFERPETAFVAEFTGATNIYLGVAHANGTLTKFISDSLKLVSTDATGGPCRAMVRPENIVISRESVVTSARNQLEGEVEAVARRGEVFEVTARFGREVMTAVITPQSVEQLSIAPGARVYFSFKAGSVHLIADGGGEDDDDLS